MRAYAYRPVCIWLSDHVERVSSLVLRSAKDDVPLPFERQILPHEAPFPAQPSRRFALERSGRIVELNEAQLWRDDYYAGELSMGKWFFTELQHTSSKG